VNGRVPDEMVRRIEEAGGFTARPEDVAAARFAASLPTVAEVRARWPAHVARYEHAASQLADRMVRLIIDAGAGVGYGAFILAQRYPKVCLETMERFKDPTQLLTDFGRALRPGGLLILSTPHKPQGNPYHAREYTLSEVKEALEERGFEIMDEQEQRGVEFVPLDAAADLGGRYMFFVTRVKN